MGQYNCHAVLSRNNSNDVRALQLRSQRQEAGYDPGRSAKIGSNADKRGCPIKRLLNWPAKVHESSVIPNVFQDQRYVKRNLYKHNIKFVNLI